MVKDINFGKIKDRKYHGAPFTLEEVLAILMDKLGIRSTQEIVGYPLEQGNSNLSGYCCN